MASPSYERVSAFQEATMYEVDVPKRLSASRFNTPTNSLKEHKLNYKPTILHSVSLLALLVITLALIGILQYAVVRLPHDSTTPTMQDLNISNTKRELPYILPRATNNITSTLEVSTTSSTTSSSSSQSTTSQTTATSSSTITSLSTQSTTATSSETTSTPTVQQQLVTSSQTSSQLTTTTSSSGTTSAYHLSDTPVTQNAVPTAYVPTDAKYTTVLMTSFATTTSAISSSNPSASHGSSDSNKNSTSSDNGDSNADLKDSRVLIYKGWTVGSTFVGTYLAVLLAVVYRMLWTMVNDAFNLIDPFRQLMQPSGAPAATVLFSFYQSRSDFLGPITALVNRRWALAIIATTYSLVNLLPALASESLFVTTNWDCPNRHPDNTNNPCDPELVVNVAVIRVLQGLLTLAAAVLLGLASLLLSGKTGLAANPRSMATIGSIMHHPGLLADLSELPVNATSEEMKRILRSTRYSMGFYKTETGGTDYGIRPETNVEDSNSGALRNDAYTPVDGSLPFSSRQSSRSSSFRARDIFLLFVILGTLGLILAYYFDTNHQDGFNKFFNSSTFGPRFIMTLTGTVIAAIWKSTEQSSLLLAPYTRLAQRPSGPSDTILFKPDSTPFVSTVRSIYHGYFLTGAITAVTLLGEGLNTVISGIPYASGETYMQYQVSAYMSIGILGIMIIVAGFLIFSRAWEARLPRHPDTLGPTMSYMSGSRILDDLHGMACLDEVTRDNRIRLMRKTYELKETLREDGKVAWTVNEVLDHPVYY